jgi:hypothetical protein
MAETAYTIQYRSEYIPGFEQTKSLLEQSATHEAVIKGNQATFLVADSGSATTTTRGVNGRIQARGDNNSQPVATLTEEHDLVEKTGFNVFASQGDQRRIMQQTSMGTVNRKKDQQILSALSAATQTQGAAATASLAMFARAIAILGNNSAADGEVSAVISYAAYAYLLQVPEFTNVDYVDRKSLINTNATNAFMWMGINFIVHPNIAGKGTASETLYVYNKSAIGHATDIAGMQVYAGYDEEQDYSWARCSMYMGAKLLQNSGVVKITHDGSAYAAE